MIGSEMVSAVHDFIKKKIDVRKTKENLPLFVPPNGRKNVLPHHQKNDEVQVGRPDRKENHRDIILAGKIGIFISEITMVFERVNAVDLF